MNSEDAVQALNSQGLYIISAIIDGRGARATVQPTRGLSPRCSVPNSDASKFWQARLMRVALATSEGGAHTILRARSRHGREERVLGALGRLRTR